MYFMEYISFALYVQADILLSFTEMLFYKGIR